MSESDADEKPEFYETREEIRQRMAGTRRRVVYCPMAGDEDVECDHYEMLGSPTALSDMVAHIFAEHVDDDTDEVELPDDWPDATDHGTGANPHESETETDE